MKKRVIASLAITLMLLATLSLPAVAAIEQSVTASVTVDEFISITLDGSISFGNVTSPISEQGTTGQINGSPAIKVNVGIETNINVDIGIKGAPATGSLALENWKYSTTFGGTKTSLTTAYVKIYGPVGASSINNVYHWITVPAGTTSGTHTITVSYKAVKTGTSL